MKSIAKVFLTVLFFQSLNLFAQPLTKERVNKLKKCVGRISFEGSTVTGTGFLISEFGNVLTCWHVIADAFTFDSVGHMKDAKTIYIEFGNGEKVELFIPSKFFTSKLNTLAVSNDFCILTPVVKSKKNTEYLKIGNFNNVEEGDEIYTAGYPLGLSNQFISKGILSTKYIDSSLIYKDNTGKSFNIKRDVALLDLTMNKGNSGGPIIKIAKSINDDEVIGIADFIINPFGANAELLNTELERNNQQYFLKNNEKTNINLIESMKLFSKAIIYSSNGISGCVSINYFLQALK